MKRFAHIFLITITVGLFSCDNTPEVTVEAPATYSFSRDGESTVSFSGQTTRIMMGGELLDALLDIDNSTSTSLLEMFRNETEAGEDANPFSDASLNESDKSLKSKTAASADLFSSNTVEAAAVKADFEAWILGQTDEVFPNENELATAGTAGQIADGSSVRYVNGDGLEYNQLVGKSMIAALMLDQIINNYLSSAVLDADDNIANNDAGTVEEGKTYTTMEHKWDEAYGYVYGLSVDAAEPNSTIGADDDFLNKYVGRVEGDEDFAGIADDIYEAFKLGRAAIVAGDYDLRDEQVEILKEKLSEVVAIRAVYYLMQGKAALEQSTPDYGAAFHDLSEGYGFIYGLQFTTSPGSTTRYFTRTEVEAFLTKLLGDGENGLWDVTPATLEEIAEAIAAEYSFTVEEAGS